MEQPVSRIPLEQLVAHREWVRRVARALVRDETLADDLEQEVWVEALQRPPRSARSLGGWLASALRHNLIDVRRSESRRRVREAAAVGPGSGESAADVVAEAELLKKVVAAVLELDEPGRGTLLLRYFEDLPLKEVARRQGIPLETVRTRVRTAIDRLRARFDAESGGDRRAWCLALAPFLRRPMSESAPAGGATTSVVVGGLLMGGKAKAAVAAGVLLLLFGGWILSEGETRSRQPATRAAIPEGTGLAGAENDAATAIAADPVLETPAPVAEGAASGGRVRGLMVLPPGGQAIVTVTRDGRPLSTRAVGDGGFSLSYDRSAADPASFLLEASGRGWKPQFLPLPAPDADVGRIRMLQGLRYGGLIEDVDGRPVPGVRVAFLWAYNVMGASGPTGPDGRFEIPLDVETALPAIPDGSSANQGIATILPLVRGKHMAAVPVDPAGFRGEHVVRIEPGPGVRIRLVDGDSRAPLPGWEVRLKSVLGVGGSTEPVHPVFDSGVTDSAGVYEPLWVDGDASALLEAHHGSRTLAASVDRKAAKEAGTLDIVVPPVARARTVAVRVLREEGGAPAEAVEVHLGWRLGRDGPWGAFRSTTDSRGEACMEVTAPEPAPPDSPVVTWGRVSYLADDGRPVMEDIPIGDSRNGRPVSREDPLVVRLGGTRHAEVTWFRIQEAETGRDLVPVRLLSSFGPNTKSAYLFRGCTLRDRSGHALWPAAQVPWQGWQGEPLESLRVEVIVEGRAPRWFDVPVDEFIRARAASAPILLEFPRSDGEELEVTVVPVDGKPRAGVVTTLAWIPRGRPDRYWEKAAQCTTDENGFARFALPDADAGARYRVVALDCVTGEAGVVSDPRPGRSTLCLESPRTLSFRVTLPDGTAPGNLSAWIEDPCFVLPPLAANRTPDGRIEIPPFVASLYEIRIQGRGPSRPESDLEPGIVRGGGAPAPPGADRQAVGTTTVPMTTWYGLRIPADQVGATAVLR